MATSVVAVKWHERTNQILLGTGKTGLVLPVAAWVAATRLHCTASHTHTGKSVEVACFCVSAPVKWQSSLFTLEGMSRMLLQRGGVMPPRRQCDWLRRGQKCQPGALDVLQTMPLSNCHRPAAASPLGFALSIMLLTCRRQD